MESLVTRVNVTKTLAGYNTSRLEQLEEKSKITNSRLEEYFRKIEQLEGLVGDQINRNTCSTLIIGGVKFKVRNKKSWNETKNVLATTLFTQFGWNKDEFTLDIERAYRGNYTNANSPIYGNFLSRKAAQVVLESIIKANREGKITIPTTQRYSKKVQDRMNSLPLKGKEIKEYEVRNKFPEVLMVKKLLSFQL